MESAPPKALVFSLHQDEEAQALMLDIKRCRANCLKECPCDIPVFSCLDSIVEAQSGQLYDLAYIHKEYKIFNAQRALSLAPYQGPGWYTRPAQEALLYYRIVCFSDFKYGMDASAHLPKDSLKHPLSLIQEAWKGHENEKRSLNALCGLFVETDQFAWSVRTTSEECDTQMGDFFCKNRVLGLPGLFDYYFRTRLNPGGQTTRPLSDLIFDIERTRLAAMYRLVLKAGIPKHDLIFCNTDALAFNPRKRKAKALEVAETTFRDLNKPKGLILPPLSSTESEEQVFRAEPCEKRLRGDYKVALRQDHPPTVCNRVWRDVEAREAVLKGEGVFLSGPPGVGKSYACLQLVKLLRNSGATVAIVSKTHVSASALGGDTCDHFVYKSILHSRCRAQWLVVDEVSMLEVALWNFLQRLKYVGVRFILLGDWNQNGPVAGHVFGGRILADDCVERSPLLQLLADNNIQRLHENKRSDQELFSFFTALVPGGSLYETPWDELLAHAKAKFPQQPGHPAISLVIPHTRRKLINKTQNEETKPEDAVFVEGQDGPMWLHPGLRLVGHLQGKARGVLNGAFYTVLSVCDTTVLVLCELTRKELELPMDFVKSKLRLGYAITQASCQGSTLAGRVRVYTHPRFTRRHLYVCSSRCTAASLLEIV